MTRDERISLSLKKHFSAVESSYWELLAAVEREDHARIARSLADVIQAARTMGVRVLRLENARRRPTFGQSSRFGSPGWPTTRAALRRTLGAAGTCIPLTPWRPKG
jgi:hypothetical protein